MSFEAWLIVGVVAYFGVIYLAIRLGRWLKQQDRDQRWAELVRLRWQLMEEEEAQLDSKEVA